MASKEFTVNALPAFSCQLNSTLNFEGTTKQRQCPERHRENWTAMRLASRCTPSQ